MWAGSHDDLRSPGSSPHLVQVRERIRINGQPISPELFTKHFWHLYHRLEQTKVPMQEGWWVGSIGGSGVGGWTQKALHIPGPHLPRAEAAGAPGSDVFLSIGLQQLCLHAFLLPFPHAHGLPRLPPREGASSLSRILYLRPWGGES